MSLIAPFTNAMRLGQGFNSYTQQICLDKAVVRPRSNLDDSSKGSASSSDGASTPSSAQSSALADQNNTSLSNFAESKIVRRNLEGQSQIVTYSAKFIDKLSDITDALNVSASLSIKTAQIGGTVKGSYVDTDKFKSSDLNFTIQVKVINQRVESEDYSEFNEIAPPNEMKSWQPNEFTSIYGDCFISGWETGGELNALISVKVLDKSKVNAIKGQLEGSLGTPALSAEITGAVDKTKSQLESSTETTISVNWSGGGKIKDDDVLWNIQSLTLVAANFPNRVSETPQKTYAILTPYTKLFDYQRKMAGGRCSPLVYENANIYTSALLDSFMDYKAIWKQVQMAMFEVENKTAKAYRSIPNERMAGFLATIKPKQAQKDESLPIPAPSTGSSESGAAMTDAELVPTPYVIPRPQTSGDDRTKSVTVWGQHDNDFVPNILDLTPYEPDVIGLDKARRDCRLEMSKIVNEVEEVTQNPKLALDPTRDDKFLSPVVFRQLVPVVLSIDCTKNRLLGTATKYEFTEIPDIWIGKYKQPFKELNTSLARADVAGKARSFRLEAWIGPASLPVKDVYFNAIDRLDETAQPVKIETWCNSDTTLAGFKFHFLDGTSFLAGQTTNTSLEREETLLDPADRMTHIYIGQRTIQDGNYQTSAVDYLAIGVMSESGADLTYLTPNVDGSAEVTCLAVPDTNLFWELRGFYGFVNTSADSVTRISALGPVWCDFKNVWKQPISPSSKAEPSSVGPTSSTGTQKIMTGTKANLFTDLDRFPTPLRRHFQQFSNDSSFSHKYRLSSYAGNQRKEYEGLDLVGNTCSKFLNEPSLASMASNDILSIKLGYWRYYPWMHCLSTQQELTQHHLGDPLGDVDVFVERTYKDHFIVGCAVICISSPKADEDSPWMTDETPMGLRLYTKSKNDLEASSEVDELYMVNEHVNKDFYTNGSEIRRHELSPPREPGFWVVKGFYTQSRPTSEGNASWIFARLGVIWENRSA